MNINRQFHNQKYYQKNRQRIINKGKEYYLKNKDKVLFIKKNRKERVKEFIRELKNKPCMDCGIFYPYYVMDFDHRDSNKEFGINTAARAGFSIKRIKLEISKCDLVCANCHRERTYKRKQALKAQLDEQVDSNDKGVGPNPS